MLRVRDGFTIRSLPDGDAVVARDSGAEAIIVNATAHAILELFANPTSEADVARILCETFPHEDPERMNQDVRAIVEQLRHDGILEECGSASSIA
jgi:coenzyme PQQ synthesis protein D (PqqD)